MRLGDRLFLCAMAVLLLGGIGWAAVRRPRAEAVLARYATSLADRTPNQVHNCALAARTLNGHWIAPGAVLSFNQHVGSWSSDSGYKRAPVSYDGELVPSWGGGVCQASSTLYNAGLLAGLEVVERHRHRWLAKYVPPGQDAAVAYSNIDLKLRNPHPWPIRVEGEVRGRLLEFRFLGKEPLPVEYAVQRQVTAVVEPVPVTQPWHEGMPVRGVRNPGRQGCRVVTHRITTKDGVEVARERLADDQYPAMNRLLLH